MWYKAQTSKKIINFVTLKYKNFFSAKDKLSKF